MKSGASPEALSGKDYVPTTGWWMTYRRSWQLMGEGWKNSAVALGPILLVTAALLTAAIILHVRRGRGRKPV